MSKVSPWNNISVPDVDLNVLLATDKTPVPCFWGRNPNGQYLFVIQLDGNHTQLFRKETTPTKAIKVELRTGSHNKQQLLITLTQHSNQDIFEELCTSLLTALEKTSDSFSALLTALRHIRRWKAFLSGNTPQLTQEQIRGLFAEIVFLTELIDHGTSERRALESWLGPEKSHQDFIHGNTAVEIKSLSGTERSSVRISSEDQLESLNENLFLRLYRISNLPNAKNAISLNQAIDHLYTKFVDADVVEAFERKLVSHSYAPLPEYDLPLFVVSDVKNYQVGENFPRLARSQISPGIVKVAYDIQLETIKPFLCNCDVLFGAFDGPDN